MPGHKGVNSPLSVEERDITEIKGADYLFEADGIIGESERICGEIFGSGKTLYSTEGSSLSIKTMVTLAILARKNKAKRGQIIAPRNCHKAFINGCILSDAEVVWVFPEEKSFCVCESLFTPDDIRIALEKSENPCAVYVTSPDYLGNICDVSGIKRVCRDFDVPLIVDNAHGAYLKFVDESAHPIDLGADMCCDSAHKTLPVLTGGGYLHISKNADSFFAENAKRVMSMYASTSPSFLILQSLDLCNRTLSDGFFRMVRETTHKTSQLCEKINASGFLAKAYEPLKISVFPNILGLTGTELSELLKEYKIEPEYADENALVLMISPFNSDGDFKRTADAFEKIADKITQKPLGLTKAVFEKLSFDEPKSVMPPRAAAFGESETVDADNALGRVCALTVTSCQPSVPVVVSGEVIDENIIKILKKYSIFSVNVLK